jgi:hypothetical protein
MCCDGLSDEGFLYFFLPETVVGFPSKWNFIRASQWIPSHSPCECLRVYLTQAKRETRHVRKGVQPLQSVKLVYHSC